MITIYWRRAIAAVVLWVWFIFTGCTAEHFFEGSWKPAIHLMNLGFVTILIMELWSKWVLVKAKS